MILFSTPDEYESLAKLNLPVSVIPCDGLEALTGADWLLSKLPINPVSNIPWHISNHSLPVNFKRGYDSVVNFDQRHKFAARIQALGFEKAFLLGVGTYKNVNGFLQVSGYRISEKITFEVFQQMKLNEAARGIHWDSVESDVELINWIKCAGKMMELPDRNEVFTKASYSWTPDDFWQGVQEIDKESVEHILACGLPGFGPKTVNSLVEFMRIEGIPVSLFNALLVLSEIDEKGKPVYKIPGVGIETFRRVRRYLFSWQSDFNGKDCKEFEDKSVQTWNLHIKRYNNGQSEFLRGANGALEFFVLRFKHLVEIEKVNPKQAFNLAAQTTKAAAEAIYKPVLDVEDGIPF